MVGGFARMERRQQAGSLLNWPAVILFLAAVQSSSVVTAWRTGLNLQSYTDPPAPPSFPSTFEVSNRMPSSIVYLLTYLTAIINLNAIIKLTPTTFQDLVTSRQGGSVPRQELGRALPSL